MLSIAAKVTNFKTIWLYLTYIQKLAKFVNSKYVNVIMYMGAAINANKIIWNFPEKFGNIVIHPGDFDLMKKTSRYITEMPLSDTSCENCLFWQCFDINLWHVLSNIEKADYNFVDLDKFNIDYCRCFILCRLLVYWFEDVVFQSGRLNGVLVRSHYS